MDEPQKDYAKQNKPEAKGQILYDEKANYGDSKMTSGCQRVEMGVRDE